MFEFFKTLFRKPSVIEQKKRIAAYKYYFPYAANIATNTRAIKANAEGVRANAEGIRANAKAIGNLDRKIHKVEKKSSCRCCKCNRSC